MNPSRSFIRILALVAFFFLVYAGLYDELGTQTSVSRAEIISVEDYIPADVPTSGNQEIDLIITRTGRNLGVDPRLIHAVIWQESRYKRDAENYVGAQGLMLLMPAAAKRFGCEDRRDPEQNVTAGTKYLRWLLKRFDGNVTFALAAYNAGEGNVDKHEGVPPFDETHKYVRIITGRYGKNHHPVLTPEEAASYFHLTPETISKTITIHGENGYGKMALTRLEGGDTKLTVSQSDTYGNPGGGGMAGLIEVHTVSRVDGREVHHVRIYYAPALNPSRVRKYRKPSSPSAEMLPVGAEFTFWAGEGDDTTPISDKVTITVQPNGNLPVALQLKESVASAK